MNSPLAALAEERGRVKDSSVAIVVELSLAQLFLLRSDAQGKGKVSGRAAAGPMTANPVTSVATAAAIVGTPLGRSEWQRR